MTDPIADLRRKFIASLEEAAKPSARQMRVWEFLRWCYARSDDHSNVVPIGPADKAWLEQSLQVLDDLDVPEVE